MWLRPATTLRHAWLHLRLQKGSPSQRTTIIDHDSNGDSNPHARARPEADRRTRGEPAEHVHAPGGDQQRPAPRGYEAALRPQGRYRVATATPCGRAPDPGDHYGPADADTTRADAYGAHPNHAADRRQDSGASTNARKVGFRLFHGTTSRRVWLRKAIHNQDGPAHAGPRARPPIPSLHQHAATAATQGRDDRFAGHQRTATGDRRRTASRHATGLPRGERSAT